MKLSALHPICIPLGSVLCVLLLTTCESPTQTAEFDLAPQFAKKEGKGKPKPPPDPSSTYTVVDLGPGSGSDISEGGDVVGGLDNEATLWTVGGGPEALGKFGESRSWAGAINRGGTRAVGDANVGGQRQAVLWKLKEPGMLGTVLYGPYGTYGGYASGVNDSGQAVGQSYNGSSLFGKAVLWEADGNAVELPIELLTVLEGGEVLIREGAGGWAIGINNSGHIVGKIFFDYPLRFRAVLWIVTYDANGFVTYGADEKAVIDVIDLTEDSDESGDNHAAAVTEVSNGAIQIAGYSALGGERFSTIWTVNPANPAGFTVDRTIGYVGSPNAMNNNGEVAVSQAKVWDVAARSVEALPTLSNSCRAAARGINDVGTVVGQSQIKVKGRCTDHTVIWTKNDP